VKVYVEKNDNSFLVPCYGFRFEYDCYKYQVGKPETGWNNFSPGSTTYVPRFTPEMFSLSWLSQMAAKREQTEILLEAGQLRPIDGSGYAFHTCLMVEGPGQIQPRDWPEKSPVRCYSAWSWTNGRSFNNMLRGKGCTKVFSGRLGLGVVYYEPQRKVSNVIGQTFDLKIVQFQTRDSVPYKPHELKVQILMGGAVSMRLSELEGFPAVQKQLIMRARHAYQS
jgi:hypothetical protein